MYNINPASPASPIQLVSGAICCIVINTAYLSLWLDAASKQAKTGMGKR